jgi:threonine dehydrogenase-like Zn-dependent dehydrogenase
LGEPLEPVYPFDYVRLFRQNVQLIGSVTPPDETYMMRAAELIIGHEQEVAFLISHRFAPCQAAEAFALYETRAGGQPLKVMIDGTDWSTTSERERE